MAREGEACATELLTANQDLLERLAKLLLEKETIEGDEFLKIVKKFDPSYPASENA
jgi:ATP-dependent Zn protease